MSKNRALTVQEESAVVHLNSFIQKAISLGASEAAIIASKDILVEDNLANRCVDPKCIYFGLSPTSPPHVGGPEEFRQHQKTHPHAIVVRIIVPSAALFSIEGKDIMRLLHEVVSGVEKEAIRMGYTDSKAFAGGSCKMIFCDHHLNCQRLSEKGECRNPHHARPSMSGFGIHVADVLKKCGWQVNLNDKDSAPDAEKMSWVAGLILIG